MTVKDEPCGQEGRARQRSLGDVGSSGSIVVQVGISGRRPSFKQTDGESARGKGAKMARTSESHDIKANDSFPRFMCRLH